MIDKIINLTQEYHKAFMYILAFYPVLFIGLFCFYGFLAFYFCFLLLSPFLSVSLYSFLTNGKKILNKREKAFFYLSVLYLVLVFLQLVFMTALEKDVYVAGMFTIFLYLFSSIKYIDKVHIIYYYFYRKILSKLISGGAIIFQRIYINLLIVFIPSVYFIFSIYLFDNRGLFNIENIYIIKGIEFIGEEFYLNFNHEGFKELLYLGLIITIILLSIRYYKIILGTLNKVLFRFSTFLIFILGMVFYYFIYSPNTILPKDFAFILFFSFTVVLIIYTPFYLLKLSSLISWEGRNNLYKKLYNKLYGRVSKFNLSSAVTEAKGGVDKMVTGFFKDLDRLLNEYLNYKGKARNYLELNNDLPIRLGDKDIFGIEKFTESILDIIEGYSFGDETTNRGSFSVGIIGEWGSGKSSVINFLREGYLDGYPGYKVYEFNPWNYNKEDLIERFFTDLSIVIGNKKVSRLFKKYLSALRELHKGFKFIDSIFGSESLDTIKSKLNTELSNLSNTKIIVIVDDLDRCEAKEVMIMLNIIKNLGDLNNVIYLVSYDKDNVINVLEKEGFEDSYLSKIINFERFLPSNKPEVLSEYFLQGFGDIVDDIFSKQKNIRKYTQKIGESIVGGQIKAIQDAHKELNKLFLPIQKLSEGIKNLLGLYINESGNKQKIKQEEYKEENKQKVKFEVLEKDVLIPYLEKELSDLFKKVNLRLVKKLLNHLKILFVTNLYSVRDYDTAFRFSKEDYLNIIIINYIKIVDYKWFLETIDYRNTKFLGKDMLSEISYLKKDIPLIFKGFHQEDEDVFKVRFIENLFSIGSKTESIQHSDDQNTMTINTIGICVKPKAISKNLSIILEKFH